MVCVARGNFYNTCIQSYNIPVTSELTDLNVNDKGNVYIKNKSPTPVKIVEMRILDKDGNLVKMCRVDVSFAGGKEIPIAVYDPVTGKITPTTKRPAQIRDRAGRFDGN